MRRISDLWRAAACASRIRLPSGPALRRRAAPVGVGPRFLTPFGLPRGRGCPVAGSSAGTLSTLDAAALDEAAFKTAKIGGEAVFDPVEKSDELRRERRQLAGGQAAIEPRQVGGEAAADLDQLGRAEAFERGQRRAGVDDNHRRRGRQRRWRASGWWGRG